MDIVLKDGKPVFIGREDAHNPPVNPNVGESSKLECPVCHDMFDYLLGDIKKGCEGCYDPAKDKQDDKPESYDKTKEVEI